MRKSGTHRFSPLRRLLSFPILRTGKKSEGAPPSEGELLFDLAGINPENLLFGRLGPEEVMNRMRAAGILEGLGRRGYHDPVLLLDCGNPEDQRVCLFADGMSRERLLMEARLQVRSFRPGKPIGPFSKETVFRMLLVHWLLLSDPERSFPVDRPRLPGQDRPGLGILPECLSLLRMIGREFTLDGVLDVPDHFHAALFYSRVFRFLDPQAEGRFLSMVRDLRGVPLALASEAIHEGCLFDAATGNPVSWEPAEQVLPLRDPLRRYLRSPEYKRVRDEVSAGIRVAVNWDHYRAKIASGEVTRNYP